MRVLGRTHVLSVALLAGCLNATYMSRCTFGADIDIGRAIELLNSEDSLDAGEAALLLGSSKDAGEPAIRALIEHLGDEREAAVSYAPQGPPTVGDYASESLVRIRKRAVVPLLCKFLASCEREMARIRALKTLRNLGRTARDSVSELKVHAQDKNERIRFFAIEAMVSVSTSHTQIIPTLQRALGDKDSNVKSAAVRGLGGLGPKAEGALPQLIPLLESCEQRSVWYAPDAHGVSPLRIDVAMTLGKIGASAKAALPSLEKMVHDKDDKVRIAAAFAHCRISGKRTPGLDILLEELKGGYAAKKAAAALGQLEYRHFAEPSLEGLKNALKHSDDLVRCAAAKSIAEIAPPGDLVCILRPLTRDTSVLIVQYDVFKILSEHATSSPDLLNVFVERLELKSRETAFEWLPRMVAAEALGKMGVEAESAIPLLRKCMETDESKRVRDAAKEAFQKILKAKEASAECPR